MLVPETSDEEEEQSKQEAPHTITKKVQEQSEQDEEEEKEGGEEEKEGGEEEEDGGEEEKEGGNESDETPQSQRLMDELNLVQRNELLRLFSKNLKSGRMVMRHFIQVRMSKNKILKGVDTDVALDYLNSKKASDLSGVQRQARGLTPTLTRQIHMHPAARGHQAGYSQAIKHCLGSNRVPSFQCFWTGMCGCHQLGRKV